MIISSHDKKKKKKEKGKKKKIGGSSTVPSKAEYSHLQQDRIKDELSQEWQPCSWSYMTF